MKDKELRNSQYEEQPEEPIVDDRPFTFYIKGNVATEAYRRAKNYVYSPYNDYGMKEARADYGPRPQQPEINDKKVKNKKQKGKKGKVIGYKVVRPLVLLAAILVVAVLVVNVLSVVGIMPDYTGMFITKNTSEDAGSTFTGDDGNEYTVATHKGRSLADPVLSLITYFGGDKNASWSEDDMISQSFFTSCFVKIMDESTPDADGSGTEVDNENSNAAYAEEESSGSEATGSENTSESVDQDIVRTICYIAMPVVIILFLIMTIYLAVKLLYSLFSGRKVKFGFCFFADILYLVIIAVLTMVWNEIGVNEAANVFASAFKAFGLLEDMNYASNAAMGLGFYISLICLFVGWILAGFSNKKIREQLDQYGRPVNQYRR